MKKIFISYIFLSAILAILITPFISSYYSIGSLTEPGNGQYRSDELSFLKIFYLMEQGESYYSSFKIARENFVDGSQLSTDFFTWRLPTSFYLWHLLVNNGQQILSLFLFLIFIFLLCSFLILRKVAPVWISILGAIIMIPYFLDTFAYKTAFLFTEWWGMFFFFFGLTALVYQKIRLSFGLFMMALLTRELFLIPIISFFLWSLLKKQHRRLFGIIIFLTVIGYLLHRVVISSVIGNHPQPNILNRWHGYEFGYLQSMISFSMRNYVFWAMKTHFLIILGGLFGLVLTFLFQKKPAIEFLLLSSISFLSLLPFVSVANNDYWGIVFVPPLLIAAPLLLQSKKPRLSSHGVSVTIKVPNNKKNTE